HLAPRARRGRRRRPPLRRPRHVRGQARPAVTEPIRLRREPPPFRVAEVVGVGDLSPHMRRITIAGPELVGFAVTDPAASVRWLPARAGRMEIPTWNGNEFLH